MFFGLFKPVSEWKIRYVVKYEWFWNRSKNAEVITFFLKQDQFGNRKYDVHSYGYCLTNQTHKEHEADMILWVEAGIVPAYAEDVIKMKLSIP